MLWDPNKDRPIVDEIGGCLLEAIDVLEKRGWCQRALANSNGNVCMAGAVQATNRPESVRDNTLKSLHKTLGMLISHWNDTPERTKDEVTAKLREIAYAQRS